jgi:hypothetical protein
MTESDGLGQLAVVGDRLKQAMQLAVWAEGTAGSAGAGASGGAGKSGTALAGSNAGGAPIGGGGSGVAGTGSAMPCSGTALAIRNVKVLDESGDGRFSPDERIQLFAELVSLGEPTTARLSVVVDDPALQLVDGVAGELFDLVPGSPVPVTVSFFIPETVAAGSEYAFQLTLTSTERSDCFAPVMHEQPMTVLVYGDEAERCDAVRQLELSNPHVVEGDGDGRVQPGEDFELRVTLTNPGPLGANWYPGISVLSSDPGVVVTSEGWLFAIGIQSVDLFWGMRAREVVASRTLVRLTLSPAAIGVRCRKVEPSELFVPIESRGVCVGARD